MGSGALGSRDLGVWFGDFRFVELLLVSRFDGSRPLSLNGAVCQRTRNPIQASPSHGLVRGRLLTNVEDKAPRGSTCGLSAMEM